MKDKIQGLDELNKQLDAIVNVNKLPALLAAGYQLLRGSQLRAPVDTGFLRASGQVDEVDEGVQVEFKADYAYYQEFGTPTIPAKGFVRATIDEDEELILNAAKKQLDKDVEGVL